MANNFVNYAEKCLPMITLKLARESVSEVFNSNKYQFDGVKSVKVYKPSTSGIANYSRDTGYVKGSIGGEWVTKTLTQEKGRKFSVDVMDEDEQMNLVLRSEFTAFIRNHVAPTIDAYAFSKIAGTTGVNTVSGDIVYGTTNVADLIDAGTLKVNEEDAFEERYLFLNDKTYAALQKNIVRTIQNDATGVNRTIEIYDGMEVKRVNKNRFYDAITQYDGKTSGQENGDYVPAAGAHEINFMIVPKGVVDKIVKLNDYRVLSPETNHDAYAYDILYSLYYDVLVDDALASTIYVHKAATAHDASNH